MVSIQLFHVAPPRRPYSSVYPRNIKFRLFTKVLRVLSAKFRNKVSILYFASWLECRYHSGIVFKGCFFYSTTMAARQKRQNHSIEKLLEMPSTSRSNRKSPPVPPKKVGIFFAMKIVSRYFTRRFFLLLFRSIVLTFLVFFWKI